jgi:hypothetical protein
MRSKLYEQYFPEDAGIEDKVERERWSKTVEDLATLVNSRGWSIFLERMEGILQSSEVRCGTIDEVNYQIGRREALHNVCNLMRSMERELKHEREAARA